MDTHALPPLPTPLLLHHSSLTHFIHYYSTAFYAFLACWVMYLFVSPPLCRRLFKCYGGLSEGDKAEWDSRVVSTVHAVVAAIGTFVCMTTEDVWYFDPVQGYSSNGEVFTLIFIGYLSYDALVLLQHKQLRNVAAVAHHGVGLLAYILSVGNRNIQIYTLLWLFTEVSTPFVNNRWFFSIAKDVSPQLNLANGLMMVFSFVLSRAVVVPSIVAYLVIKHWDKYGNMEFVIKVFFPITASLITVLNNYWSYLIIRGLIKHMSKGNKKRSNIAADKSE